MFPAIIGQAYTGVSETLYFATSVNAFGSGLNTIRFPVLGNPINTDPQSTIEAKSLFTVLSFQAISPVEALRQYILFASEKPYKNTHTKDTREVEGLLFNYKHFYGSYNYVGNSRRWYRREIRIVRPNVGVRSWGDAQGFQINGKKLHVKLIDAAIYHYGWVKPPEIQQLKQKTFNKFWHSDEWVDQHVGAASEYNYMQGGILKIFNETHPAVMTERVRKQNWIFTYNSLKVQQPLKEKILDAIESQCGWRIGEYKNYIMI